MTDAVPRPTEKSVRVHVDEWADTGVLAALCGLQLTAEWLATAVYCRNKEAIWKKMQSVTKQN